MADFLPAVPQFDPLPALGQDDLLRLFDRLLPPYYLEPLKDPGPGYEYLQAVAKVMARVSGAVAHMGTGCYIGSATGGARARGVVRLDRPSAMFGAVDLYAGTLVGTTDGYLYQTLQTASFGATDVGPLYVPVEAIARGWEFNKPGETTTFDGELLPGSINQLVKPRLTAGGANFDPTITVRQVSPTAVDPYELDLSFTQPLLNDPVWVKLVVADINLVPWLGCKLTIGTQENQQDIYEVVNIGAVSGSTITLQIRLVVNGLNAPGSTVAAATEVYANSDTSGGISQMLDALGVDRGMQRQVNYGVVSFTRTGTGQVTIAKGSTLLTADSYRYMLMEPVVFTGTGLGPVSARIMPLLLPDEYMQHGQPSSLDIIYAIGYGSLTGLNFSVVSPYQVEGDEAYRARIAMLPQVVTPQAIQFFVDQTVGTAISVNGHEWSSREIWDIRYQTAYDTPINQTFNQAEVNVPVTSYNANIFAYDYTPTDPLSNRYLDPDRGVIVFALPEIEGFEALYASLAQSLEAIKPAGITLSYILT